MPDSVKVALLTGAGAPHVEIYLDALGRCAGTSELSVADASREVFPLARNKWGRRFDPAVAYTDPRALLRERRPDLAVVTLEAGQAPAVIESALDANCHVLAEKPACVRVEDFERLNAIAETRHRYLMLAFATRTSPLALKCRDLVRGGALGKLYGASMVFLADQTRLKAPAYQKSWFASPERAGGGQLIWLGIHYVDLLQFVSGRKVTRVCGFTENAGGQPIRVEDSAAVSFRLEGGLLATLQSGYYLETGYRSRFALWGSGGWLEADLVAGALEWRINAEPRSHTLPAEPPTRHPQYPAFVQAVVDAVRGSAAPPVTGRESLETLRAVFGLYQAAATGRTQILPAI